MIEKVMNALADKLLEGLGRTHNVDKKNTKLRGSAIFKGMLLNVLKNRPMTLRGLEDFMNKTPRIHEEFKARYNHKKQVSHNGLASRILTMPLSYTRSIYDHLVSEYQTRYDRTLKQTLNRFDSTLIQASSKVFTKGINCGGREGRSSHRDIDRHAW